MKPSTSSPADNPAHSQDNPHNGQGLITQQLSYSGPLPPSSEMERYEHICPGAANRTLKMSESEQAYRHETETKENEANQQIAESNVRAQDASIREIQRGQWMAFILGLMFLFITALLGLKGYEIAASALGLGGVAAVAAVFIKVRKSQ